MDLHKKIIWLICITAQTISAQGLYDLHQIQELKIYFTGNNWDAQLDSLKTKDPNGRLVASYAILNGQRFDSVGVRYKGNSSYNPTRLKNPLNVKLDYVKSGQQYESFNTLKLSNVFMDPSFLREVLGYHISRQYLPASRANFIRVYINDGYLGLYSNVENTGSDFLSDHFGTSDGSYFQCDRPDVTNTLPGTCPPGNPGSALRYISADSGCYYNSYEKESDAGWSEFLHLMRTLNQDQAKIPEVLNVDRVLWMMALNNVFVNLDSYSGSGHNYLMYESADGRFHSIMWDLNEFYGAFVNAGTMGQLTVQQMRELDPMLHQNNPDRPLISKILSNASYQKRYLAHIKTILEDIQSNQAYENLGIELQNLIRTSVQLDRNKFFSDAAFEQNLKSDFANTGGPNGGKTYPGLVKFTNERKSFLQNHLRLIPSAPIISELKQIPEKVEPNDLVSIIARIQDASHAFLYYRSDKHAEFEFITMNDDGLHDDGQAGDGIYGVRVSMSGQSYLQYYLYAENAQMASLLPTRAAYEFYQINSQLTNIEQGAILINELLASNQNGALDEQGEYEDWMELYNTTDRDISLKGLHLSDNPDNALKYALPDTIIHAKSYLIVWADEDGKDSGIHANFKLSKSGETVKLYNADSSLISGLTFPELSDDESFGLCNAIGQKFTNPSFNSANHCTTATTDQTKDLEWLIFPNPNKGWFQVEWKDRWQGVMEIRSVHGNLIWQQNIQSEVNEKLELHLQDWPCGIYVVSMRNSIGITNQRFILTR
ncbi:MAG: CotH kinase family protein [Saprospiraceae bacterium]|nr:CotH kinase family protein [Saprospiraceae bacterium]